MDYTNEICPVCDKAFTENDDIVVCPICGTPHHRQCYIDNKNCKNETLHKEGFEWQSAAPSVPDKSEEKPAAQKIEDDGHKIVFCPNCGKENPAEEPVCTSCGARLYNNGEKGFFSQPVNLPDMTNTQFGNPVVQISPDDTIGGNKVSDTAEYIQMNANKYIPKMYKMEKTNSKVSFNWASFLFTPYWFFFRKMYVTGFVLMLVLLFSSAVTTTDRVIAVSEKYEAVVESYYEGNASIDDVNEVSREVLSSPEIIIVSVIEIGVHLFGGFFGNYFYKKKTEKDIREIQSQATSPEEYRLLLFKKGGISGGMCALAMLGYYCAEQLVYVLMTKI